MVRVSVDSSKPLASDYARSNDKHVHTCRPLTAAQTVLIESTSLRAKAYQVSSEEGCQGDDRQQQHQQPDLKGRQHSGLLTCKPVLHSLACRCICALAGKLCAVSQVPA